MKRLEESLDGTEASPANRKRIAGLIETNKAELESLATEEQQRQTTEMQSEEQLRIEQAKLNELEERMDRLEKALDNNPHWPPTNRRNSSKVKDGEHSSGYSPD